MVYDFGDGPCHIGIVERLDLDAETVTAIEGNTSSGTDASQTEGGGVYRRVRALAQVATIARPRYGQRFDR